MSRVPVKLSKPTGHPDWHPSAYMYVYGRYVFYELLDIVRHLSPGTVVTVLLEGGKPSVVAGYALEDGWTFTVGDEPCT